MHPFNAILKCLCMNRSAHYNVLDEQPALNFPHKMKQHPQTTQSLAADILLTLYATDIDDEHLVQRLQDIVCKTGWYKDLTAAVLTSLQNALKAEAPMGQAMKDTYEKAAHVIVDVFGFAKEHPVFCAVVALGILVILALWALEALGFGELGPIEGTFAAWWQLTYGGYVPARSLFSFFQRLGMIWRLKLVPAPVMVIPAK